MYLVACKWIANGEISYKQPMEYLSLPTATDAEMEYGVSMLVARPDLEKLGCVVDYSWKKDENSLDIITLTYYNDKDSFDMWNTSPVHATFLEARDKFLNTTGIQLISVEKAVNDIADTMDYATANQLFL